MPIDPNIAIGAELPVQKFSWTSSDVQHYHLALGAGSRPLDEKELRYLTDGKPQVLPTFATVAANFHATEAPRVSFPGVEIDLANVVHGSQEVTVHQPIPPEQGPHHHPNRRSVGQGQGRRHRAGIDDHRPRRHSPVDRAVVHLRPRRRRFRGG